MKNNKKGKEEKVIEIPRSLVVALIVTLSVLITLAIALVVVMNYDGWDFGKKDAEQQNDGGSKKPKVTTTADHVPAWQLVSYPTTPSLSSYNVATSSNVKMLTSEIGANNTVLVKVEGGKLVSTVEKDADAKIYPASMTKVMTVLVASENIKYLEKPLEVTQEIADYMASTGGSGVGLKVGEKYTVEDLMYLIIYRSDTIASLLIANEVAGSEEAFVAMMNAKAREIGLTQTNFTNCTGLHDANHYTTCKEMAAIMAYALDNPMAKLCLTSYTGRPMTVGGKECTFYAAWYSNNPKYADIGFSDKPKLDDNLRVIGGKTGYIDEAGFTFVTVAERGGQRYINVTVGKPKGNGYNANLFMTDLKMIYNTYAK